ncbi:Chitinase 1 [Steccherinum ochraceum]|uniref:chitinase n=1 Tax=Steccherinum ochraceum TaxID=92696 RepID=A0A4R0S0S4_9APHY|nr:Chitinase 1 [Steccherinum ochraceum]
MSSSKFLLLSVFASFSLLKLALAFDNTRFDNKPLAFYCEDDAIDVFPVAFVNTFFGPGGVPSMNLANICNTVDNTTFPGTNLPNCASVGNDIKTCQAKGKIVTLSLGGAGGAVGFSSDSQGETFADTIWNVFLGGSSATRPFGSAVLDGVDLDIEGGSSTGYAAFVNRIRSHASGASKKYFITAAPQCPFPDASLGGVLNAASFDAVYVQFCKKPYLCFDWPLKIILSADIPPKDWDFGLWDDWARQTSPNKNVKIYVGAPASSTAAGSGYQDISTLTKIAVQMRKSFPSFGGVMLWDASQAYVNGRYDLAVKNALSAAGGTGFTYPACSAPAFAAGTNYQGGSQVSFGGYIWQAKFFASSTPSNSPNGEWSAISACSGTGTAPTSVPTSSPTSPPTSGSCAGIAAWSSGEVYTGGQQATFNGHLWTAKWWTEGDTPGGEMLPCGERNVEKEARVDPPREVKQVCLTA